MSDFYLNLLIDDLILDVIIRTDSQYDITYQVNHILNFMGYFKDNPQAMTMIENYINNGYPYESCNKISVCDKCEQTLCSTQKTKFIWKIMHYILKHPEIDLLLEIAKLKVD